MCCLVKEQLVCGVYRIGIYQRHSESGRLKVCEVDFLFNHGCLEQEVCNEWYHLFGEVFEEIVPCLRECQGQGIWQEPFCVFDGLPLAEELVLPALDAYHPRVGKPLGESLECLWGPFQGGDDIEEATH